MDIHYYFHKTADTDNSERVYSKKQHRLLNVGDIFELNEYNFSIIWPDEQKSFHRNEMEFGRYLVTHIDEPTTQNKFYRVVLVYYAK